MAHVTWPMSSAPRVHGREEPATSRAWSPAETRSRSVCSPRPRTFSPGSRSRRSARSRPTPRSTRRGAGDPIGRALLRDVVHPRPGGRAGTQPQLPRQPSTPLRADRARGRDLRPARGRRNRGRHAPITRDRWPRTRLDHDRRAAPRDSPPATGPAAPRPARGRQQYFVNPGLQLDFFVLNTHRTLFSDVRVRQAVNYAIDRRALARLGRRLPAAARAADRPLPAAGNARLPRRTRLSDDTRRSQRRGELVEARPRRRPNRRPLHLRRIPMPTAGADRQDRPRRDRPPGPDQDASVRERCSRGEPHRASPSTSPGTAGSPTTPTPRRC